MSASSAVVAAVIESRLSCTAGLVARHRAEIASTLDGVSALGSLTVEAERTAYFVATASPHDALLSSIATWPIGAKRSTR